MRAQFNALDRLMGSTLEATFGEMICLVPWKTEPYTAGCRDMMRPRLELKALVTEDQGTQRSDGNVSGVKFGVEMTAGEIRISISATTFQSPEDCPRKDDLVQAFERDRLYKISRIAPDNADRLVLHCTDAGELKGMI